MNATEIKRAINTGSTYSQDSAFAKVAVLFANGMISLEERDRLNAIIIATHKPLKA